MEYFYCLWVFIIYFFIICILGFIWWKLENRVKIVLFLIWFLRSFRYGLEEDLDLFWYERILRWIWNPVTQSEGFKDENKIKQIPNTDPWMLLHHVVFLPQSFHIRSAIYTTLPRRPKIKNIKNKLYFKDNQWTKEW
jgi:hypothetical protein